MKNALTNNEVKVILKNDPAFPPYLDFEFLRREGIRHLGELSGRIWTDHNIHDPGITILEMLCYALIDLGYRTQLPIEDLLAVDQKIAGQEDNFFTPAEILTNNPLTILDYRKLIIDTPGVRNAWLEVDHEQALYLQMTEDDQCRLSCRRESNDNNESNKIGLNGLYNVYLELERPDPVCADEKSEEEICAIVNKVKAKLHQYRNLGEDFLKVHVLCQENIGFCGRITLEDEADAEEVNLEIYLAIHRFLSPEIQFHTLEEMLDKGKSMEEIYSGKPYFNEIERLRNQDPLFHQLLQDEPCLEQTYGFIDEDQLRDITLRKEIHLSDIYALISCIDGVRSVRGLTLKATIDGNPHQAASPECGTWVHHLAPDHLPVFCPEITCFDFSKGASGRITIDQDMLIALFKERAAPAIKAPLNDKLDLPLPQGRHLADLGDYYSIQNEFPRNYGIGEGGLSPEASDLRKAQALQLKGYLLFYDQLLANYLGQVSHLRDLFSFLPDSDRSPEQKKTYFGGGVETVPQIDQLVRFYTDNFQQSMGWVENTVLALPVEEGSESMSEAQFNPRTFNTPAERQVGICQLQREFRQGEYDSDILPDECGYIFTITTNVESMLLHSKRTYKTHSEAQIAAKTVTFLATLEEAYRPVNNFQDQEFSFELVFKPVDYVTFLQSILEDPQKYCQRRNEFLDHLLARFAESFTDYSVLVYGFARDQTDPKTAQQQEIESKGRFLKNYPLISRNRGRAFNYLLDGWNTLNISGLERRVAALSGMEAWERHYLCNFEIYRYVDKFMYQVTDESANVVLSSMESYNSEQAAMEALESLIETLKTSTGFGPEDKENQRKYGIVFRHPRGVAVYPVTYLDRESRDRQLQVMASLFRSDALEVNVYTAQHIHRLELQNFQGETLKRSRKQYKSAEEASEAVSDFAENINGQLWVDKDQSREKMELVKVNEEGHFLNILPFRQKDPVSAQYRWILQGQGGEPWLYSADHFLTREDATRGFARFTDFDPSTFTLETAIQEGAYSLRLQDTNGHLIAHQDFDNEKSMEDVKGWVEQFISSDSLAEKWIFTRDNIYAWEIWQDDNTLLQSQELYDDQRKAEQAAAYAKSLMNKDTAWEVYGEADTSYGLVLKDKYEVLAASAKGFKTHDDAQAFIADIKEAWGKEGAIITQGEQGYSFNIPQKEGNQEVLLTSYRSFRTKYQALKGIEDLLSHARRKSAYFPSGDEANLNFSFLLRGPGRKFMARHPVSYASKSERDKALNDTLKILKQTVSLCTTRKEFIYTVNDPSGEELLRSANAFDSMAKAKEAFLNMLPFACAEENYQKITASEGYSQLLRLCDREERVIAVHPYGYVKWEEGDQIIQAITRELHPHRYITSLAKYPYKWKYRYYWESPVGAWETLLESKEEFNSKEDAREAYHQLLNRFPKIEIVEKDVEEGSVLSFKYHGEDEPFALSPKLAPSVDSEEIKTAAAGYFERAAGYQRLLSVDPERLSQYIHQVPGKEGGNYVYRMVKKDQYVAYHPCECGDEPLEATCERLYGFAQAGYQYLDICLGGDITCLEVDEKWHFLLRDKATGEIYFKSYEGYGSREEAEKAFRELYLKIIAAASTVSNYGTFDPDTYYPILTEETFGLDLGPCPEPLKPLAVVAEAAMEKYGVQKLADLACSYPIRIKWLDNRDCFEVISGKYHFLLRDKNTGEVYFKSYQGYASEEEAKCAFEELGPQVLEAACDRESYGAYDSQKNYRILTEELFEQDYSQAPGEPWAVVAGPALEKFGIEKLIRLACKCPHKIKINLEDECLSGEPAWCYYFHLVGHPDNKVNPLCKLDWKSERCWDTVEEAREAFRLFKELLKFKGNYHSFQDVEECCCYRLVIREVLLESCSGFEEAADAWEGLSHLLEIICKEGAIHKYWDDALCCHGIKVVDPDYCVATHPYCYYHPDQAKEVIEALLDQCRQKPGESDFLSVNVNQSGEDRASAFSFSISDPQENVLWNSFKTYAKTTHADSDAWKTLSLSESKDFYGATDKDHIGLFQKNKKFELPAKNDIIAIHQSGAFTEDQLVEQALHYPCRKMGDYYYYQLFCEDFEVWEVDETPQECLDGKIDTHRKLKKVKGAVVWKSKQQFASCEEVESAFTAFCELLGDQDNYEVIEIGDCEKYQIQLTDPAKVLACHPQCYSSKERLQAAIGRIKKCADLEGMHLVEHILLRPNTENCECFLPILPDPDCPLEFDLYQDDPCAGNGMKDQYQRGKKDPCETLIPGADPYSFWVTVVLPCWTKRFRRGDFREIFQNLLRKEAPAHLGLNIVWVDPRQMCKFEEQYRDWLRWLSCKERCNDSDPYCSFINCLSALQNCPPDTPEDREACDCNADQPFNRTNLFINYAFTAQREAVYGKDFLNILGLQGGFSFLPLGNVISLPKSKIKPLFPKVFPILEVPDLDVGAPILPVPQETEVDKEEDTGPEITPETERNIRQRLASYAEHIETIGDRRFKDSEAYERTKLFLSSSGDPEIYKDLMQILVARRNRARSKEGKERHLTLMQIVTGYFLDQQVIRDRHEISSDVRGNLKELAGLLGKEAPKLIAEWNGNEWKSWYQARVVNKYMKLFK